jgi:hypothetical protein
LNRDQLSRAGFSKPLEAGTLEAGFGITLGITLGSARDLIQNSV